MRSQSLVVLLLVAGCGATTGASMDGGGSAVGGGTASGGGSATGGGGAANDCSSCPAGLFCQAGVCAAICTANNPCPSGQFCFNGVCALGCQSNANCAANQYCDTDFDHLCHNTTVPTCTGQADCLSSQLCISNYCSTPPPTTQCDPNGVMTGNDGCDARSICYDPSETSTPDAKCYSFPACAENKSCPVGAVGAVCNDGIIPNKARICLTGLCRTAANCPANWGCFKANTNDVVGACSNRAMGSPCLSGADCVSGTCTQQFPGLPGFCG